MVAQSAGYTDAYDYGHAHARSVGVRSFALCKEISLPALPFSVSPVALFVVCIGFVLPVCMCVCECVCLFVYTADTVKAAGQVLHTKCCTATAGSARKEAAPSAAAGQAHSDIALL